MLLLVKKLTINQNSLSLDHRKCHTIFLFFSFLCFWVFLQKQFNMNSLWHKRDLPPLFWTVFPPNNITLKFSIRFVPINTWNCPFYVSRIQFHSRGWQVRLFEVNLSGKLFDSTTRSVTFKPSLWPTESIYEQMINQNMIDDSYADPVHKMIFILGDHLNAQKNSNANDTRCALK